MRTYDSLEELGLSAHSLGTQIHLNLVDHLFSELSTHHTLESNLVNFVSRWPKTILDLL